MASRSSVALLSMMLSLCLAGAALADEATAVRDFALHVGPLLKAKCFACHGDDPDEVQGGFDIRGREGLLRGGDSEEPALVPGDPEESPLLWAVRWDGLEMPPKENDRLNDEQIEHIRRWISAGAPWPSEAEQKKYRDEERAAPSNADGLIIPTSGGQSDEWTYRRYQPADVWAFQPLGAPDLEAPGAADVHPVDSFLGQTLGEAGFEPAPSADPLTLIRRATFDLIGLPPTPEEVARFEAAHEHDAEQAWTALIDRLLASPHYGERWGQHWLDAARYSDTGGFSNDYERSNMWRYRDYVIRAFNDDKPYDEFVVEQLAGDELADASVRERTGGDEQRVAETRQSGDYTPEESEWIVATGFLRMGAWDDAMVKAPEARQIYLDDVVNAVGQTFLSTTMRCVKCHDHKFDPIPTRDYYGLYAAFAGTQMAERPAPFLDVEKRDGFDEGQAFVERMLAFAVVEKDKIKHKQEEAARQWYAERKRPYVSEQDRHGHPDEEKPPVHVGLTHVEEGQLKVREQDERIWTRRLERYQPLAQSVYNGADLTHASALKLRIRKEKNPDWRPTSAILMGGSLEAAGEAVSPSVLSAVSVPVEGAAEENAYLLPDELSGRRLGLARWIADARNPLSTRSIVNRVWQHHFGLALARNPNNFGAKGAKPTHPELLDWLTADFVDEGWRLKRLHRLIMTSRAYRQAGNHSRLDELRTLDPENRWLAYFPPRRLTAEELRDGLLAISGELNPATGGPPIMPEINMEVALEPRMIQFSIAPAYQPSRTPRERNRRTIYAYRVRGQADPFLELFNQPNPNDSCEQRDAASVTPQVFTLLNSDVMTDRSLALSQRLEQHDDDLAGQVTRAYQLVLGRGPEAAELERLVGYVEEMRAYHAQAAPPAVVYPTRIRRSLVEEFTGQPFEYDEILPIFEDYEPDVKPADVGPETRALADLCLLLFNSNEFMYVY